MTVPPLEQPQRYRGLYVYDFGDWTAVGYTAEEVAILLESEATRSGQVYKIHRAYPDGHMELRGVSAERFRLESAVLFCRTELESARQDFAALTAAARHAPPPCRAFLHLTQRPGASESARFVTAVVFPAEHDDEIGQWLLEIDYRGGDLVEGGVSHVSNYYAEEKTIIERQQLWSRPAIPSRSAEQVLANVRRAVQR